MTSNIDAKLAMRDREERLLDLHRSMRRSTYVLHSGEPSREYVDVDGYFLGGDGDYDFDRQRAQDRLAHFIKSILPKIVETTLEYSVSRLAFLEKGDDGPVGMLAMMGLILYHSGLDGCIIRPAKRLTAARVKGRPILAGERILILSDVATSGSTIARPATLLRELGAIISAAFVLVDRCQGAEQKLRKDGIKLISYWQLNEREKILVERIQRNVV